MTIPAWTNWILTNLMQGWFGRRIWRSFTTTYWCTMDLSSVLNSFREIKISLSDFVFIRFNECYTWNFLRKAHTRLLMITQGKGWKQTVHRWSKKQNFQNNSSIIYVPMASFETGGSYFCSSSAAFRFFMTAAAAAARTSLPVLWRRPLRPLPSINKCMFEPLVHSSQQHLNS